MREDARSPRPWWRKPAGSERARPRTGTPAIRAAVAAVEVALVFGLLVVWLTSEAVRTTRSLWVLFFYSFPSEFLIAVLPHEPALLLYGETYPAFTVALVAVSSTVLAEVLNYSLLGYFDTAGLFENMRRRRTTGAVITLFKRAPFVAIIVAGFTPIPFFPVRFLAVMTRYPIGRYALGVFLSRAPRFLLIAALGQAFTFPGWALALLFAVMIVGLHLPLVGAVRRPPLARGASPASPDRPSVRPAGRADSQP